MVQEQIFLPIFVAIWQGHRLAGRLTERNQHIFIMMTSIRPFDMHQPRSADHAIGAAVLVGKRKH